MKKKALIFGVTGQDGAYLSKFLLKKKYIVHGVKRRSSSLNTSRVDDIYLDPHKKTNFYLHYGDLSDSLSVLKIIKEIKPDEIYNLAAQSHVSVSFDVPEYTANVTAIGTLRILDAIFTLKLQKKQSFIKRALQKCLEHQNLHKMKKLFFILEVHMELQNFMLIGLLQITERLIIFLLAMEFYLIMKVR